MPAQPQIAPIAATSASVIAVQVGQEIPGDAIGGVPSKVSSVSGIFGWEINESTGSATAKFRLRDGTTAAGREIATINLAAGASSDIELGGPGSLTGSGIFLEVLSGSVEGSILWG